MDQWRRTHYSSEIPSCSEKESVIVMGWVSSIRDHGNLHFVQVKDRFGETQVVAKKGDCPDSVLEHIQSLKEHSSLAVKGYVRLQQKSPTGAEIVPIELKIFSNARNAAPFMVQGKRSSTGLDTRLDLRAVDLRRNILQSIFRIRDTLLRSIREFLAKEGFLEVNTPKMIATATEGGAALFPIFYYDREAFLAQSPQLYKEQLTMAFENVFEIAPIFRAEPSRTNRHLSEAMSVDVEKAYVDYTDMMDYLDNLIRYIIQSIMNNNQEELQSLGIELPDLSTPFRRITYSQLVENLQNSHKYIRWGDDITPKLLKDLFGDEFYFITDWPSSTKPFYVKAKKKDSTTESSDEDESRGLSESFDLMYGSLELSSGSTRINNKEDLMGNMKKKGL